MCGLDGKVAVVTGASRGLGRAIARELHNHGAYVIINYYQSGELAEELVAELNAGDGRRAFCIQAGVAHPDEVQAMMDTTVERFGGIDILVNNAGVSRDRTLKQCREGTWYPPLHSARMDETNHHPAVEGGSPCAPYDTTTW